MKSRNPDKVFDESELAQNALNIVRKHVQDQLKVTSVTVLDAKECKDCLKTVPKIDNSDQVNLWNFVRFHKEKEKDQQQKNYAGAQAGQTSTMMTPSGDYVVLEAKEMLKHFNPQGLPAKTKSLENLNFHAKTSLNKKMTFDKLKCQSWPEVLLTEFHDLYYNKNDTTIDGVLIITPKKIS